MLRVFGAVVAVAMTTAPLLADTSDEQHRIQRGITCFGGLADSSQCPRPGVVPVTNRRVDYGAIAYSESDGIPGTSWGYPTRAAAEEAAMDVCKYKGGKTCRVIVWAASPNCIAIADGTSGEKISWGLASTAPSANDAAVNRCVAKGGAGCALMAMTCAYSGNSQGAN